MHGQRGRFTDARAGEAVTRIEPHSDVMNHKTQEWCERSADKITMKTAEGEARLMEQPVHCLHTFKRQYTATSQPGRNK